MAAEGENKEVYYGEYCHLCIWYGNGENEWPCDECLDNDLQPNSHKPERFEPRLEPRKGKRGK